MQHFVYLWHDLVRDMFYIGSHSGDTEDGYVSSSRWLNAEVKYRPTEFRRRIVKILPSRQVAQELEYRLLSLIRPTEFGQKYYNIKTGRPLGIDAWNKGQTGVYSEETLAKMSKAKRGNVSNTGKRMPHSAENGRKGAAALRVRATGRKKVLRNGSVSWSYPGDTDYPRKGEG